MVNEVALVGRIEGLSVKTGKEGGKNRDLKLILTETPESLDELEALMGETLVIGFSRMQTEMELSSKRGRGRTGRTGKKKGK